MRKFLLSILITLLFFNSTLVINVVKAEDNLVLNENEAIKNEQNLNDINSNETVHDVLKNDIMEINTYEQNVDNQSSRVLINSLTNEQDKKDYPTDIEVTFDSNIGIIINSNDKDYLKCINQISIRSSVNCYNENFYKNDSSKKVAYDEDNQYAYISNESLYNAKMLTGICDSFCIYATGYSEFNDDFLLSIVTSVKEPPTDLTFNFDSNIGIIINSNNKDYLKNIIYIYMQSSNNNFNGCFYKDNYSQKITYDENNQYAYIDNESLFNANMPTGIYNHIHIDADEYAYFDDDNLLLSIVTSVKEAPTDLTFCFDSNIGIIINSNDKDYLKNIYYVDIHSSVSDFYANFEKDYNYRNVSYDENNQYAYINNESLYNANMPTGVCDFISIDANGYRGYCNNNLSLSIVTSIKQAPTDLTFSFVSNVGIIINSNNKDYLKNIANVDIHSTDKDIYQNFNTTIYDTINQYAYISISNLNSSGMPTGIYDFISIDSDGYAYFNNNKISLSIVTSVKEVPTDLTFIFDSNIGIKIYSNDKDYLKNINNLGLRSSVNDHYASFYSEGNTQEIVYDNDNQYAYISNQCLCNAKMISGIYDYVFINADGYIKFNDYNLSLSIVTSVKEAPTDLTFSFDSNVGIIINSNDKDYLKNITDVDIRYSVNDSYGHFYKTDGSQKLEYDKNNQYVFISNESLYNAKMLTGDCDYIYINADGYEDFNDYSLSLLVRVNIKEVPTDLTFSFDSNVGIIINSNDKDYLKNIFKFEISSSSNECDGYFYKENDYKTIYYDESNGYAYISNKFLENTNMLSGVYDCISISSILYNDYTNNSLSLSITTSLKEAPTDLTLSFDSNVGIIINSNDKDYLKSIYYISIQSSDNESYEHFTKIDEYQKISYDFDKLYAYINNESINNAGILTSVFDEIYICAVGYATIDKAISLSIVTSVKEVPIDLTFSFDSNVGLIINSNNKDYLKNIYYIYIYSSDNGSRGNFNKSPKVIFYDNVNQYTYISNQCLYEEKMLSGIFNYISIYSYGYEDVDHDDISLSIITTIKEAPTDLTFSFDSNIGIIINSNDKNYLKNIVDVNIESISNDFYRSFYNGGDSKKVIYDEINQYSYINNISLYNAGILTGICNYISIEADGYTYLYDYNISLSIVTSVKEAPTDLTFCFDSNIGIFINSNDKDYLKNINQVNIRSSVNDSYDDFYNTDSSQKVIYDENNQYANISNESLYNAKMATGVCDYIYINANGYSNYSNNNLSLSIITSIKEIPEDLKVEYILNKGILIKSSNSNYLNNIEKIRFYGSKNSIELKKEDNVFTYDKQNNCLLIKQENLDDGYITSQNLYSIYLESKSYANLSKEIYMDIVSKAKEIDDIDVYYDQEIGLVIKSEDRDYLKKIERLGIVSEYFDGEVEPKYSQKEEYSYVGIDKLAELLGTSQSEFTLYYVNIYLDSGCINKILIDTEILLNDEILEYYLENHDDYQIIYQLDSDVINNELNPTSYNEGEEIVLANPTRIGYVFNGWYDLETNKKVTKINQNKDITLYAKWTENTYKLVYNANGGSGSLPSSTTYKYSQSNYVTDKIPTKKGYEFLGWSLDKGSDTAEYFAYDDLTNFTSEKGKTITLYAIYSGPITYTIELDNNEGELVSGQEYDQIFTYTSSQILTGEYNINSAKISLPKLEKEGYSFIGWYMDQTDSKGKLKQVKISSISKSAGDLKIYALFKPISYKITYKLNGGKNNNENPSTYNIESIIELKEPTRTGYIFEGWYLSYSKDSKTKEETFDDYIDSLSNDTGNITVYAKWVPITYTIRFVSDEDSFGEVDDMVVSYDQTITLNQSFLSKPNYVFNGWLLGKKSYSDKAKVKNLCTIDNGVVELTAKWKAVSNYSIKYNLNKGKQEKMKNIPSKFVYNEIGEDLLLPIPTRTGYIFEGWYKDADFEYSLDVDQETNRNIISTSTFENYNLYAKWTPITYTINFEANNMNVENPNAMASITLEYDETYVLVNEYVREGISFNKFTGLVNGKTVSYKNNSKIKNLTAIDGDEITLYATWTYPKDSTFKITYNLNGGKNNPLNPSTYNIDSSFELQNPTKKGYEFDGWYLEYDKEFDEYSSQIYKIEASNENEAITLYAKWEVSEHALYLDYNGGTVVSGEELDELTIFKYTDKIVLPTLAKEGYSFDGWYNINTGKKVKYIYNTDEDMELEARFKNI